MTGPLNKLCSIFIVYVVIMMLFCVQGHDLNVACGVDEVHVWVGNATCKVNSLDAVTLYCSPPPATHHDLLPTVTVCVAGRCYFLLFLATSVESIHASVSVHLSVPSGRDSVLLIRWQHMMNNLSCLTLTKPLPFSLLLHSPFMMPLFLLWIVLLKSM